MPRNQLRQQLVSLQQALIDLQLWQASPPSVEALSSTTPFCCDTLSLPEWLQWVFIPRMTALLEGNHPLPTSCDILDYAQYWASEQPGLQTDKLKPLLNLIAEIDSAVINMALH